MHNSAIAPRFPTEDVMSYLSLRGQISEFRFCSVQGEGPQFLEFTREDRGWTGSVHVVCKRQASNGLKQSQWEQLFGSVGWTPFHVTQEQLEQVGRRPALWAFLADLFRDSRGAELNRNLVFTRFSEKLSRQLPFQNSMSFSPRHVESPRPGRAEPGPSEPTDESLIAYARLRAAAVATAPEPPEQAAAQAAAQALQWSAIDQFIRDRVADETGRLFAEQPAKRARRAKASKAKKDKAEEAPQASQASQPSQPDLSLSQMVAERGLAGSSPQWELSLREMLATLQPHPKNCTAVKVLRQLIPEELANASCFSLRNRASGLGQLYPIHSPDPEKAGKAGSLELHRGLLRLEQQVEGVLREVGAAVAKRGQNEALAALGLNAARDLQMMWAFGGGLRGEGVGYWPKTVDPANLLFEGVELHAADLYPLLILLKDTRPHAFSRRYLVAYELQWALPYICKLFFLRKEKPDVKLLLTDVQRSFDEVTKYRKTACQMDAHHLVEYGRNFVRYAERLWHIASLLDIPTHPLAYADALFKGAQTQPVSEEAIRCRIQEEITEARNVFTQLGIPASQAFAQAQAINAAIIQAMSTDSYQRRNTLHLPPTPSLPQAKHEPWAYCPGASAGRV